MNGIINNTLKYILFSSVSSLGIDVAIKYIMNKEIAV